MRDKNIFSQQINEEIPLRMTPPTHRSLIRLTHMQSFNQIARSGDKWGGKIRGTLNLWLTESCEGTLKSPPKSFKLGHIALAFVTLMLHDIADSLELEVKGGNFTQKKINKWVVDNSWLLL